MDISSIGTLSNLGPSVSTSATEVSDATSKPKFEVDEDEFLKLLVTQLQYQNPLDPMDGHEFMAELAQFSALEKLNSINIRDADMQLVSATSMIGKTATYLDLQNGVTTEGKIDGVEMDDDGIHLLINGGSVPMTSVSAINETVA